MEKGIKKDSMIILTEREGELYEERKKHQHRNHYAGKGAGK